MSATIIGGLNKMYYSMKNRKELLAGLLALSMLASCTREVNNYGSRTVEFRATWGDLDATRTVLQSDETSIWWSAKDEINAFYGNKFAGRFTSQNTSPQAVATFQGTLTVLTGTVEAGNESSAYWAVYPYDAANTCDGEGVTLTVPQAQSSVEGSFTKNLFPAIATSKSLDLAFYNVCGGARFSVEQEGITSVRFKANGGEPLVGTIKASFDENGIPVIKEVIDGKDEVIVTAPSGGFIPGKYYFAVFLPQTLSNGLTLTYKKGTATSSTSFTNSITVNRSKFGILDALDKDLEFTGGGSGGDIIPDPSGIISFADERIKAHCVAAYDANGDGEISYAEAAAVTTIEGVFTSTLYTSFNEFKYFTGIKEIPDEWFKGRGRLTSIALPEGLTRIGKSSFENCNGLLEISFPSTLVSIGGSAFKDCSVLSKVHIPNTDMWVKLIYDSIYSNESPFRSSRNGHLFINGEEVTEIIIPDGISVIPYSVFYGCAGISSITIPKGVTRIYSLDNCSQLQSVHIPSISEWLEYDLGIPFGTSMNGHLYVDGMEVKTLVIPLGITTIRDGAFQGCVGISSVSFPDGLTTIGRGAFQGCKGLRDLSFPNGLTTINVNAFRECSSLSTVTLSKGLQNVYRGAFRDCNNLKRVNIPSITDWLSINFCPAKNDFNPFASDYTFFASSKEGHLYLDGEEITEFVVPEEITNLGVYAFLYCTGLEKIVMEPTVPPSMNERLYTFKDPSCPIFVWKECYDAYCNSWSAYKNILCIYDEPVYAEPEPVDMGLSVKWASFNLGARMPEDAGRYFAWGETALRIDPQYYPYPLISSSVEVLPPERDAAHVNLGKAWRMPTKAEFKELIDENNCSHDWMTLNGVEGMRFTSKITNNSIFFPDKWAYWSSSVDYSFPQALRVSDLEIVGSSTLSEHSIRPVSDD